MTILQASSYIVPEIINNGNNKSFCLLEDTMHQGEPGAQEPRRNQAVVRFKF